MAEVYRWVPVGVARMAGESSTMDDVAQTLLKITKARAERHRLTGNYIEHLSVISTPGKKGVRDRMVLASDIAAESIEWGHAVRIKGERDGNTPDFRWVPGQHILGGAIAEIPGHGYRVTSFGVG